MRWRSHTSHLITICPYLCFSLCSHVRHWLSLNLQLFNIWCPWWLACSPCHLILWSQQAFQRYFRSVTQTQTPVQGKIPEWMVSENIVCLCSKIWWRCLADLPELEDETEWEDSDSDSGSPDWHSLCSSYCSTAPSFNWPQMNISRCARGTCHCRGRWHCSHHYEGQALDHSTPYATHTPYQNSHLILYSL